MAPVCPKCGGSEFAYTRDAVKHLKLSGDTHMVTWVFCSGCGCVVGCHP
ncbi:MAG: hypothetical protein R6U89_07265 [Dehalococcoidia bacterium]